MYHCTLVKCYLSISITNRKLYKVNRQNEVLMCVFKHLNSLDTESNWTKYSCRWNGQHWGDVGVKISCYKTGCVITIPWTISLDNYLHVNVQVTVVQVYLSIILIGHVGHVGQSNHINVSLIHWYYAWAWVMILCIISPAIFAQVPRELRYDVENNSLTFLLKFLRPCRISNDALWSHKLF